jgi:hypothetical protein
MKNLFLLIISIIYLSCSSGYKEKLKDVSFPEFINFKENDTITIGDTLKWTQVQSEYFDNYHIIVFDYPSFMKEFETKKDYLILDSTFLDYPNGKLFWDVYPSFVVGEDTVYHMTGVYDLYSSEDGYLDLIFKRP